jgi:esterase/lipase superfamily enzyme
LGANDNKSVLCDEPGSQLGDPDDFAIDPDLGDASIRFGHADVTGATQEEYEIHVHPEALARENPTLGSKHPFRELRTRMRDRQCDTIVFIQGFDYTFCEALTGAARLSNFRSDHSHNMFLFTWPSDGKKKPWISYKNDRRDAKGAGEAAARAFLKVADFLAPTDAQREAPAGGRPRMASRFPEAYFR